MLGEIHAFGPWQIAYKATNVLCPDGKRRSVHSLSQPDSVFSIPGTVKAHGKSVRGYITGIETDEKQDYATTRGLSLKVGQKGGVVLSGLNSSYPVTLYAGQWERVLTWLGAPANNPITLFIAANEANLDRKA